MDKLIPVKFVIYIVGCLPEWSEHRNSCISFMESPWSWSEANDRCLQLEANLATIEGDKQYLIRTLPESFEQIWYGVFL